MTHPAYLPSEELLTWVQTLMPKEPVHWSVRATVLGRITDEALWRPQEAAGTPATPVPVCGDSPNGELASTGLLDPPGAEAWCADTLDLSRGQYRLAMKLWGLIKRGCIETDLPPEGWLTVSQARALLLDEVLAAGGTWRTWWTNLTAAKTTREFRSHVRTWLKQQEYERLVFSVPKDMLPIIQAAMERAVPYVLGIPQAKLGPWQTDVTHARCLELVCGYFTREVPVMKTGGEEP